MEVSVVRKTAICVQLWKILIIRSWRFHMAVKRGKEVTAPASGEVWDADQSQFARQAIAPEFPVEQSVEGTVKAQGGGSIQPPWQGEVHDGEKLGGEAG